MKSLVTRIAAAMIACCLPVSAFSQSMTVQDAAKNPAVHKALLQKIDRDQEEIQAYKVGHVVVGRIPLEGTDDPRIHSLPDDDLRGWLLFRCCAGSCFDATQSSHHAPP